MKIGGNEIKEIQIVTNDNELIASIADNDTIVRSGYKVVCVPAED